MERLQKFLAAAGVASRREAERMITAGRVTVNGSIVSELGMKIDPEADRVAVDGRPVFLPAERHYYILNKPAGVVTTLRDRHAERTVADLLSDIPYRVYPVGRLDKDSTGLLLLTDDGEIAMALTHPRHHVEKVYRVTVKGRPSPEALAKLRTGVDLSDGRTAPAKVEILGGSNGQTILEMTIHEGRKRQIRRMTATVGHPVTDLVRVRLGPLSLGDLEIGSYRPLTPDEVRALRDLARSIREKAGEGGKACCASKTERSLFSPPSGRASASTSATKGGRGGYFSGNGRKSAPQKRGNGRWLS